MIRSAYNPLIRPVGHLLPLSRGRRDSAEACERGQRQGRRRNKEQENRFPPSLLPLPGGEGDRRPDEGVRRRGSVTIVALVTLLILSALLAQYTRRVLMERRQFRQEILHQQAEKLADAGMQHAEDSRKQDPAWQGLTWNLPVGTIHQTNSAEVVIRMQDDTCTVVARYPANNDIPYQVTRTRKMKP